MRPKPSRGVSACTPKGGYAGVTVSPLSSRDRRPSSPDGVNIGGPNLEGPGMRQVKPRAVLGALVLAAGLPVAGMSVLPASVQAASPQQHVHISCYNSSGLCTEVGNSEEVFGEDHYVGHDEPGVHFFSDQPGAETSSSRSSRSRPTRRSRTRTSPASPTRSS